MRVCIFEDSGESCFRAPGNVDINMILADSPDISTNSLGEPMT
jgi:hypothetical protein